MISVPPHIPDPYFGSVLTPIEFLYDAVQLYDASDLSDPWKHYNAGKTDGNDVTEIISTSAFWIYMRDPVIFVPLQLVPESDFIEVVQLVSGWNFVGYPSVTTRDVTSALAGVPYDMVWTYDAVSGRWLSYDPNTGSGDLTVMELGRGYWIHSTADHDWGVVYV
jgi:hypothetical protein